MGLRVVVSGSFRRQMADVAAAVQEFHDGGHIILSPAEPRVVDAFGDFVYVASDRSRLLSAVQGRHFVSIDEADLLWVACNDGYTGASTSAEIGYAISAGTPIFGPAPPHELQWRDYLRVVASPTAAADWMVASAAHTRPSSVPGLLLNPEAALEHFERQLPKLEEHLTGAGSNPQDAELFQIVEGVQESLRLPGASRAPRG